MWAYCKAIGDECLTKQQKFYILVAMVALGAMYFGQCYKNCGAFLGHGMHNGATINYNSILLTSIICISIIAVAIIIAFVVVYLNSQKVELEKERLEKLKEINSDTSKKKAK